MNKKGMTLIELIAVIAIISIITLMIAPDLIDVRNRSIRSTLDGKITRIQNAALKYGTENIVNVPSKFSNPNLKYPTYMEVDHKYGYYYQNGSNYVLDVCLTNKVDTEDCNKYCLIVYVNSLIQNGYLSGDDESETTITHPLTGASLNDQKVCIRYDTGEVSTAIAGGDGTGAGIKEGSTTPNRKLVAYVINERELYNEFN